MSSASGVPTLLLLALLTLSRQASGGSGPAPSLLPDIVLHHLLYQEPNRHLQHLGNVSSCLRSRAAPLLSRLSLRSAHRSARRRCA